MEVAVTEMVAASSPAPFVNVFRGLRVSLHARATERQLHSAEIFALQQTIQDTRSFRSLDLLQST